ncbi:MAG: ORF6N domain-containing protein [Bacteroidetes bacterium]|nr:MAG: ORF6N domain-containing protein [Bacteroidota bacterium]
MATTIIQAEYQSLIFEIRGYKVMIDTDLAALYETETKVLKQQVRRNIDRFPQDFMFQLAKEEKAQLVTNCDRLSNLKHSSVLPMAFTEQGVAMLSSVLRSKKAIKINIEIMRTFAVYRAMLIEDKSLSKEINALDEKINEVFRYMLDKIDALHQDKATPRKKIGYKDYQNE